MTRLTFNVNYRTVWGETLCVCGGLDALGAGDPAKAMPMTLIDGERWELSLDIDPSAPGFDYTYIVRRDDGSHRSEWGQPHRYIPAEGNPSVCVISDAWQDRPEDAPFLSQALTDCVNRRTDRSGAAMPAAGRILLEVTAPEVAPDQVLGICGEGDALGNWDPGQAVLLSDSAYPVWSVTLPLDALKPGTQYKFVVLDKSTRAVRSWETGTNRSLDLPAGADASRTAVVIEGLRMRPTELPRWRGAGTAIPVFSLRSDEDFGVGDFIDLKLMVDWAVRTGQSFIQILPINDTTMTRTWTDSYPYKANSTFALHPLFLRVDALGSPASPERRKYFEDLRAELNSLSEVDYERVSEAKEEYVREIYNADGKKVVESPEFRAFVDNNRGWLMPYAAFCVLRDRNHTADFTKWGEYAVYDRDKVERFTAENSAEINFVYYQQYYLDKQMREVHEYAHAKGVALKGDIPIGISRTSVDAWQQPHLFYLDSQAGAPPDDFSVLGQNWGLPTYNWEEMARDGFAWWKARFCKMAEYFDAYRIDHILGFFRIWQIPMDALHGLLGVFHPALPFTVDELRESYDFWLDIDLQTTPFIMDYFLPDFFGEYTDEARERFLIPAGYGRNRLREEFNTQRKVADYFAKLEKNEMNTRLCNALLGLIDEVLFVEDPYEKGKYHPRISAQFTYIYRSLNDYQKWCYNRLYNDFYYHRHNDMWYHKAMWKLPPLIDATRMLTCAEDLGMIPDCVPAVIDRLRILSLEIQRMPKDPGHEFGDTRHYPYFSVCTTSTHDMSGIRGWWEENHATSQHYYNQVLGEAGEAPYYAEPWICDHIVRQHLQSPSMLCILPLQDWLSIDGSLRRENPAEEQINVPANPRHYWRYRMHMTMQRLLGSDAFNSYLRDAILSSGR